MRPLNYSHYRDCANLSVRSTFKRNAGFRKSVLNPKVSVNRGFTAYIFMLTCLGYTKLLIIFWWTAACRRIKLDFTCTALYLWSSNACLASMHLKYLVSSFEFVGWYQVLSCLQTPIPLERFVCLAVEKPFYGLCGLS